ncbi:hypothetical protein BG000_009657, partial [Podila horticola]
MQDSPFSGNSANLVLSHNSTFNPFTFSDNPSTSISSSISYQTCSSIPTSIPTSIPSSIPSSIPPTSSSSSSSTPSATSASTVCSSTNPSCTSSPWQSPETVAITDMDILEMPMVFPGSNSLDLSIARTTELMQLTSFSTPSPILSDDMYGERYPSQQQSVQQQQLQQQQMQLQYDLSQIKLGTPPVSPLLLTSMPTFSQIQHPHVVPASPSTQPHL